MHIIDGMETKYTRNDSLGLSSRSEAGVFYDTAHVTLGSDDTALRNQLKEKDKRIAELENEIKLMKEILDISDL